MKSKEKRVVVGEPFDSLRAEAESAEVVRAKTEANESKTRSNLAYWAVAGGVIALTGSAVIGLYDGSFNELQSVWNIAGPILGGVYGHYFGGTGKKNDKSKDSD